MAIRVVILAERSAEPITPGWLVHDSAQALAVDWQAVARRRMDRAAIGPSGAEVYFCFLGDHFKRYDHNLIQTLAKISRQHVRESETYAVVDNHDLLLDDSLIDSYASLDYWFRTALRHGVDDLLETRIDRTGREEIDERLLRNACDRSKARGGFHDYMAASRVWQAVIADRNSALASFLDPFLFYERSGTPEASLLIVVETSDEIGQRYFAENTIRSFKPAQLLIATLGVEPKALLREYCHAEDFGLARFRGPLELRYFLSKVNTWSRDGGRIGSDAYATSSSGKDVFVRYENALQEVLPRIPPEDFRQGDSLVLDLRLRENIYNARNHGDTEILRSERSQILGTLNNLTLAILGVSFNTFCR